MEADIFTIFKSDFYQVLDFKCRCKECVTSKPEYSDAFSISFVRKGNFLFNVFRNSLDAFNGCILVTKPGYERTVTHTHAVPDECTIFEFKKDFYRQLILQYSSTHFLNNRDLHSTLVRSTAELEFIHYFILNALKSGAADKLQIDNLVIDIIEKVLNDITEYKPDPAIHDKLKKNHLSSIELAKEFITTHFFENISLLQIAQYCCISPFHFSRIFKTFTGTSPYQYLQSVRLKNASILLNNTSLPVSDIAFTSGFQSIEYFSSAFRNQYKVPPTVFRSGKISKIS